MTIDEYLKKNNINPFDDVLDIIDLMKKRTRETNDSKPIDKLIKKCDSELKRWEEWQSKTSSETSIFHWQKEIIKIYNEFIKCLRDL